MKFRTWCCLILMGGALWYLLTREDEEIEELAAEGESESEKKSEKAGTESKPSA